MDVRSPSRPGIRRPRIARRIAVLLALFVLAPAPARAADTHGASAGNRDDTTTGRSAERRRVARLELGTPATVHRILRDGATAAQRRSAGGDQRPASLLYPIPGARIGRGDGSGTDGYHHALDIIAPEGTPILAAESGLVLYTGDGLSGYGNLVAVLHAGGWMTYYAHMSAFLVRPGQLVDRGQRIGRVGETGRAHGPHLHFELWMDGEKIDAYPFFRPAPGVPHSGPLPHIAHHVRGGDTWSSVAERYGVSADDLRAANHLAAGTALRPGWQLIVPRRMDSPPENDDPDPGSPAEGTYVVQAGDTLSQIAERYSVPLADLARWNDLADPGRIRTGMVLMLNGEEEAPEGASEDEDSATEPADDAAAAPAGDGTADAASTTPPADGAAPPAVADAAPPQDPPAAGDLYVVRPGDTLAGIARTLGIPVADVARANPDLDPDRLQAGRPLHVPDVGGGPANEAVATDGGRGEDFTMLVEVRAGDSLWSIARHWNTSVRKLRRLNPQIGDDGRVRPGQRLRVPQPEH